MKKKAILFIIIIIVLLIFLLIYRYNKYSSSEELYGEDFSYMRWYHDPSESSNETDDSAIYFDDGAN